MFPGLECMISSCPYIEKNVLSESNATAKDCDGGILEVVKTSFVTVLNIFGAVKAFSSRDIKPA
jgi:hypothetical protein